MNPDEAKVPNVEKDWQSIEIFLFSNGQQYSPPRKYLLRVDELNLWDATLNQLAQSHYGLQSPLINLYTTNGHLVKGPLDLRDGQAYVAVAPPDRFVDAGYQKYLIRASRSWEKRQARKKPPECVPDDPCCLCPEKQRSCCDPQACCLCPEREDADSLEHLLPATGHPELRPAGGHYMSSAPSKPVAANEYAPVSGEIGQMTCEHCKNRASPYGYSPIPTLDNPNGYGTRPGDYAARLAEDETRQSINEARPDEFGAIPTEYRSRPGDETKPILNVSKPCENSAKQVEYGARPNDYETKRFVNGFKPVGFGAGLGEYVVGPSEYEVILGENAVRLSLSGARQDGFEARPPEHETKANVNGTRPEECCVKPVEYETKPSTKQAEYKTNGGVIGTSHAEFEIRPVPREFETKPIVNVNRQNGIINGFSPEKVLAVPAEYDSKPKANGTKPGEYEARQGEYETKPSVNETKPDDFLARPAVEHTNRSAEQVNRPDEYLPSPVKNGSWSGEYGDRPTGHKARPGHSGPWSSKIEPIKEAYEIALREENRLKESENRLDKDIVDKDASIKNVNEYTTRDVEQKDKEIEPKDQSRGNGVKGGECKVGGGEKNIRENNTVTGVGESKVRKIENARRLSGRGGAEIEQGASTGESTRRFEYGGRVSAQKARETNPAGRASGQGARLSEQKNKHSDNLARMGGRESRVGDHEDRAGDLGFQTCGHDASLENNGSREAEPGARAAASGFRATPRDRMNSRAKTGNLGQPKIIKPGAKTNEASVKLDDSEVKHRESNPGVRHSRVGRNGTAGALHISDAQQHARRNTLTSGRTSIDKKHLSIGQNPSILRKPTPNSSILRKSEDRQPIKSNKDNLQKKITEKASPIPIPASKDTEKLKTQPQCIAPSTLPPSTISITNIARLTPDIDPLDNDIDEKEIIIVSTHSFKDPESETKSMRLDSVKHVVSAIDRSQDETQTDLIYVEKSVAYVSVNEEVQTNTEKVEQQGQEVSTSKQNDNSCTCSLCRQPNHKAASDPDENTLSMLNKGGIVNIKLNIEVRNIVKSVYSCQKNCGRSRSLTNVQRPEKESEISIEDDVVVNRTSLQSLFNKQNFGGFGFEGSPKVMVVQCAGCGRLNTPPRCDPPPCCDSNKKYFVLLNSVLEDMEDGCNFNPPCRPCDQRQSRKQSSGIPIKQAFSETTLDTITTVTVSGVPLQRRETGKCATNTSCQTDESQNECMTTKRKVSITQDSGTKCDLQKKSSSSVCVATQAVNLVPKQSCLKMFSQKCEYEESQVCSEVCQAVPICEKVRSVCSHGRPPTCEKVRLSSAEVPSSTCEKVGPDCSQVIPPGCENIQPDCSQVPLPACEKVRSNCSQIPPPTCENVRPDCSQVPPPKCEKARLLCTQEPLPTCEKVRSVCSQIPLPTCEKVRPVCSTVAPSICDKVRPVCSQEPVSICEKVRSVCSQVPPPTCEKVRSLCSQVSSQTCSQAQTKGCQPLGPQVQSQGCMIVSPKCAPCCPKPPPPCLQIQTQARPQLLQYCNAETQTRWSSILLQARLHCDGRYSFHLPPLHLLKSNCHSCCQ